MTKSSVLAVVMTTLVFVTCGGVVATQSATQNVTSGFSSQSEEIANRTAASLHQVLSATDPRVRPDVGGPPVDVSMNFYISSFGTISEISMDYRVDIFLREYWSDSRMRYAPFPGQRVPMVLPSRASSAIWLPDVYFPNEKQAHIHDVTSPNQLIRIYPNGSVEYSVRLTLTLACPMDLSSFPMDRQTCMIKLESFGYETSDMIMTWQDDPVEADEALELPQFELESFATSNCYKTYKTGNFPCLKATFSLRRNYGFFLLQTYIPSVLIVILSWVSFWINMDAIPARISLGVTTVLTMATQLSGSKDSLPKVSYPKAIDIWMALCMIFVFAALLEYAFVNALSRQGAPEERIVYIDRNPEPPDSTRPPRDSSSSTDSKVVHRNDVKVPVASKPVAMETAVVGGSKRRDHRQLANKIDMASRVLFPGIFIIFNFVYWPTYIYK